MPSLYGCSASLSPPWHAFAASEHTSLRPIDAPHRYPGHVGRGWQARSARSEGTASVAVVRRMSPRHRVDTKRTPSGMDQHSTDPRRRSLGWGMASLPPTHAHAKRRDVSVESALSDSTYPCTATHGPSRRGPGGIDTPHPPPLDVFGTDLSRLAQDDRATPTGLLELDPDTPTTSGSETDEPWPPPRSASHSSSCLLYTSPSPRD